LRVCYGNHGGKRHQGDGEGRSWRHPHCSPYLARATAFGDSQCLTYVETWLEVIDRRFEGIDRRLDLIDKRLDGIDVRLNRMDRRLDGMDKLIEIVQQQMGSNFVQCTTSSKPVSMRFGQI
jgi:hypothetical protein